MDAKQAFLYRVYTRSHAYESNYLSSDNLCLIGCTPILVQVALDISKICIVHVSLCLCVARRLGNVFPKRKHVKISAFWISKCYWIPEQTSLSIKKHFFLILTDSPNYLTPPYVYCTQSRSVVVRQRNHMWINHPAREKSTKEIELSTLAIYEAGKLGRDKNKKGTLSMTCGGKHSK